MRARMIIRKMIDKFKLCSLIEMISDRSNSEKNYRLMNEIFC